ncbi:ScpA family protein, partial [Bacteriovorax sp. DB6_IX]|uniref:segregation and condensation protein A n=2 Tax=Bacteriovorax sp. DB6_IX TaxID=1353530 RepID=UPI00038A0DCD
MLDTTIKVKTDCFDGPLALLLMLIQKEQMSVKELDLTKITKQYLDYLANMKELNFDIAGDYLYLAATLVLLKSKNCVTEGENSQLQQQLNSSESLNITSHAELVRRLEELQHFQRMGQKLLTLPQQGKDIFTKPKINRKEIVNSILTPMDLEKLTMSMVDFIFRQNRKYTVVRRDRLSIVEKLQFLKSYLQMGQKTNFEELLHKDNSKKVAEKGGEIEQSDDDSHSIDNVVITFISLLELARLKRIQI